MTLSASMRVEFAMVRAIATMFVRTKMMSIAPHNGGARRDIGEEQVCFISVNKT